MSGGTADLVARLWERFRPLAQERVGAVGAYVDAVRQGSGDAHALRPAAAKAAHDLVGSLGSYGRPAGTTLAAELETAVLAGLPDPDAAADAVARLRQEVDR